MQLRLSRPTLFSESHPLSAAFAALTLALICGLFIFNNLAGFFGLPSLGPMSMFSGLRTTSDNHFLMPRIPLGDADVYVAVRRLEAGPVESPEARQFRALVDYVNDERRFLHLNVVRWQVSRTCQASAQATLRLTLRTPDGQQQEFQDACQESDLARYDLLSTYPPCGLSGCVQLRRFLRAAESAQGR